MTDLEKLLKNEAERLLDLFRQEMFAAGKVVTGKTSNALRVESDQDSIRLIGPDYVKYLIYGRGPTQQDQGGILLGIIRQWIQDKGLVVDNLERAAYAITKTIHERGTNPRYWATDLIKDTLDKFNITSVLGRIKTSYVKKI